MCNLIFPCDHVCYLHLIGEGVQEGLGGWDIPHSWGRWIVVDGFRYTASFRSSIQIEIWEIISSCTLLLFIAKKRNVVYQRLHSTYQY